MCSLLYLRRHVVISSAVHSSLKEEKSTDFRALAVNSPLYPACPFFQTYRITLPITVRPAFIVSAP